MGTFEATHMHVSESTDNENQRAMTSRFAAPSGRPDWTPQLDARPNWTPQLDAPTGRPNIPKPRDLSLSFRVKAEEEEHDDHEVVRSQLVRLSVDLVGHVSRSWRRLRTKLFKSRMVCSCAL
jgi:hypothetical protein